MKICWANYALWAVIAVLGVGSMLSGCGNKGPLYHPTEAEQPQAEQQQPAQPAAEEPAAAE